MPLFMEKSVIISLKVDIKPADKAAFVDWQADFNEVVTNAPGFVSLEFISSSDKQESWTIVQRFINAQAFSNWRNSDKYKILIDQLKTMVFNAEVKEAENEEAGEKGNITQLIVTEVHPGKENDYRAWAAKIHHAEAKFPGFRGVYVQSPEGNNKHWITLLQFDTKANLDHWLQSPEREKILKNSSNLISSLESHRVISPYAGWFASIAKTGEFPPVWKQTMLVLLVLFPIVVFELKYLSPLISSLNSSLATFIGNAISVTLISFPMMPIVIYFLGWWLSTHNLKTTLWGTLLLALLYMVEIALFWNFLL